MNHITEARREAVYYLGLCELVEARLATSAQYKHAVLALDAAWRWVEHHYVPGSTLANLGYDEYGFGVG